MSGLNEEWQLRLKRLEETLYGNGKEGLLIKVDRIEQSLKYYGKMMIGLSLAGILLMGSSEAPSLVKELIAILH